MYDPNETIEIEVDGLKLKCLYLTGRQVKEVKRLVDEARTTGAHDERHDKVDAALAVGLVDFDPNTPGLSLQRKLALADNYPWEATIAEANRLKKVSDTPSDSPTP